MSYRGEQKIKDKIYVYEAVAVWNPDKKRSEQRRVYIGRKDPDTGAFLPNRKYEEIEAAKKAGISADDAILRMFTEKSSDKASAKSPGRPAGKLRDGAGIMDADISKSSVSENVPDRSGTYAEDALTPAASIGSKAVTPDIRPAVPSDQAGAAMSDPAAASAVAPFPVSAEEYGRSGALRQLARSCGLITVLQQTLPGSGKKFLDHVITGTGKLPRIDETSANVFFQQWIEHCGDLQYLSLYTDMTRFYPDGTGAVPQLNVLWGADSELPLYYRFEESGPSSVRDMITGFAFLRPVDLQQIRFCFQEDFYTDKGFFLLLQHGFRFLVRIPMNAMPAASLLKGFDPDDHSGEVAADIGGIHFRIQSRRTMINGREVYCHFCCDTGVRALAQAGLLHHICVLEQKVQDGSLQMTDTAVRRYLSFSRKAGEGWQCSRRADVIRDELKYAGYFIILSNAEANGVRVLKTSISQVCEDRIFNRSHADAASLPQVQDIQGSDPWPPERSASDLFCSFLELILHSYLQRKVHHAISEGHLPGSSTPEGILEELSAIRRVTMSDGTRILTQLTQRQEAICEALGLRI